MFTVTRLLHFKVVEWTNKRVYLVKVSTDNSVQEIQLERKNWYYSEIPICQTSMGNENRYEKSGVKLHCSTEGKETSFGSSYRVVRKSEGLKKLGFHWTRSVLKILDIVIRCSLRLHQLLFRAWSNFLERSWPFCSLLSSDLITLPWSHLIEIPFHCLCCRYVAEETEKKKMILVINKVN